MICTSCGDETGANYCASCGSSIDKSQAEEGPGGIGVAGSVILLLTAFVIVAFYIQSHPNPTLNVRLPRWMNPGWSAPSDGWRQAQSETAPAVIVAPTVTAPPPPRDPYEEISSTRMEIRGAAQLDVRVRLVAGKSVGDVELLLRSRIKNLRSDADSVMLRLYDVGSEGLSADRPLLTLTATKPGTDAPEQTPSDAKEVEPGIFRAPPQ